jgi:hypothetical protein
VIAPPLALFAPLREMGLFRVRVIGLKNLRFSFCALCVLCG